MKLQLQTGSLRVRIDEAELARLLAGETLVLSLGNDAMPLLVLRLVLAEALALTVAGHWQLALPRTPIEDYVATLPNRAACGFRLASGPGAGVQVDFEVDVRDSLQQRGPRRRPG